MKEIKPCPFCGSSCVNHGGNYGWGNFYVICNKCQGMMHDDKSMEDVIEKWNRRHEDNKNSIKTEINKMHHELYEKHFGWGES